MRLYPPQGKENYYIIDDKGSVQMGQLVNMRLLATVDDLEHIMLITNTNMHKMPYLCKGGLMIINFKRNNHVEKNVIGVILYIDYLVNNENCFFRMKHVCLTAQILSLKV